MKFSSILKLLPWICFLLLYINPAHSQQAPIIDDFSDLLQYSTKILTDAKSINPALAGDTLKFRGMMSSNSTLSGIFHFSDFAVSAETFIKPANSGLAISADYIKEDNIMFWKISAFYNYRVKMKNGLGMSFGTEIGLNKRAYDFSDLPSSDPLLSRRTSSSLAAIVNFGANMDYKNHSIGIAYRPLEEKFIMGNQENYFERSRLFLNYTINLQISNAIGLSPEILETYNFGSNSLALLTKLNFKDKILLGLLYNSDHYSSLSFSARFFKVIELGYAIHSYSRYRGNTYNCIFLKFIIK